MMVGPQQHGAGPRGRRGRGAPPPTPAPLGPSEHRRLLLETAILIALLEKDEHGYALTDRVARLVGDQVLVDPASIYRCLRSLEEAGIVRSSWEIGPAGPPRRTYTLEPAGRELLLTHARVLTERAKAFQALADLARNQIASTTEEV